MEFTGIRAKINHYIGTIIVIYFYNFRTLSNDTKSGKWQMQQKKRKKYEMWQMMKCHKILNVTKDKKIIIDKMTIFNVTKVWIVIIIEM